MFSDLVKGLSSSMKLLFTGPGAPAAELQDAVNLGDAGARLSNWLPYRSFRPEDQVFINRDSLGFVLEALPQTGADAAIIERLKGLYTRLPTDSTLQISLFASPNVVGALREYANLCQIDEDAATKSCQRGGRTARNENVFRTMARRRFAHFARGARQPLIEGMGFMVRDFRLFISVTMPGSVENLDVLDHLIDVREGVKSTLESARFPNRTLGAADLIQVVGEMLNPAKLRSGSKATATYDDMLSVADQCVDRDTTGDWSDPSKVLMERVGGSDDERVELRFLSVQRTPKQFALWGMGSLIGDLYQDTLQVPCPFLITMGVVIPDQKAMASAATIEKAAAERDAGGDFAKFSPAMGEKTAEWTHALKALSDGGKLVWNYHQIVLFARPGEGRRAEGAMRDVWKARSFELVTDAFIHRTALLQALPMTLSKPFATDLQRFKRLALRTSGNTMHLAPMVAEAKGTGTPTLIGLGRRGQLMTLDFYDNTEGGKNVSIVGATGSGKSTLLQEIAAAYASKGALVRCFEAGRSFERLTHRVGGQFVVFSSEFNIRVNPFSMVSEPREVVTPEGVMLCGGIDDDIAMLQPMLAKMASPLQQLEPAIYATFATVIKEEYTRHGHDTTVTHIWARYREGRLYPERSVDQRLLDVADMLAPFSAGGAYANYFEGHSNLDFGNSFLVFELQELSANPHLKGVIQMILLYRITQEMLEERKRQKVFIMDEAKDALSGSGPNDQVQAEFLEKLYLRVRKYNGSAITATQDVAHYLGSVYGNSIWNQSDFILMGSQSENSIEAVRKGEAIRLDENLRRLLNSLGGGGGHFKEWYVHSPIFKGVMRLVLNPSTLLLFSNRSEDNVPLDDYQAQGMDVPQAIDQVLSDRGIVEAL